MDLGVAYGVQLRGLGDFLAVGVGGHRGCFMQSPGRKQTTHSNWGMEKRATKELLPKVEAD